MTGTVTDDAEVYFQYGTTTTYGLTTPRQNVEAGPVQAPVTNLTAETTYHYRLVAVGESPGNDQTFTTIANPQPPAIANQHSREITPDAATTTATVNANGGATTYTIEWGTTTRYGSQTAAASAGNGRTPTAVTARLTGLNPYTLYHWRTVATNAAGTTRGRDRTFRTARLPSAVTIGLSRRTVPWGGDLRIGGRVTGAGASGLTVALQQQRFPIDADFAQLSDCAHRQGRRLPVHDPRPLVDHQLPRRHGDPGRRHQPGRHRPQRRQGWCQRPPPHAQVGARRGIRPARRARHASLQRYRSRTGWRQVRFKTIAPADAVRTRYSFSVRGRGSVAYSCA